MRICLLLFIFSFPLSAWAQEKTLLVLGDSISAAYGMHVEQGWVHLLQARLDGLGYRYKVHNASISGDTTRGARVRLDRILEEQAPALTIIELGGNDGLRGLSLEEMSANLEEIITTLQSVDSSILLVPMRLPPNYGAYYIDRFAAVYTDLAATHDIMLSDFILQGIAANEDLMQSDGVHPRAQAQALMLDNVWASLQPLLERHQESSR